LQSGRLNSYPKEDDKKAALEALDAAATAGHDDAIDRLAGYYFFQGRDLKKMAYYLELSMESPENAYRLGNLYFKNFDIFPDVSDEKIMALYILSAEGGSADGQYELGERLKDGTMIERDEVGALKWALISNHTKRGELEVVGERAIARFVTGLTQKQLDEAQGLAEQWVKEGPG